MLLFLVALVALLIVVVRRSGQWGIGTHSDQGRPWGPSAVPPQPGAAGWSGPVARPEDDALKLLADRLASGDITPEEYQQRVSVLRQQP